MVAPHCASRRHLLSALRWSQSKVRDCVNDVLRFLLSAATTDAGKKSISESDRARVQARRGGDTEIGHGFSDSDLAGQQHLGAVLSVQVWRSVGGRR